MRTVKTYLVIVEVSQKQAYIFSSNKLSDNVKNSKVIAYVTGSDFFEKCADNIYNKKENDVYCGGGHAVLEFSDRDTSKQFIQKVTTTVIKDYPGLELFATIRECDGEPNAESISLLREDLEKKKSLRRASFSQGTFGVEQVDPSTRDVVLIDEAGKKKVAPTPEGFDEKDKELYPEGFERAFSFENLGGSKDESNFIAVVHIDGNGMGKRLEDLAERDANVLWNEYRDDLNHFSENIAKDFKDTFKEMCDCVAGNIEEGQLGDITLKKNKRDNGFYFPIRLIIDEGDDICFVTEGRIGLECARIFLQIVNQKKNLKDERNYPACAGVAIVHQKYPFYRAYELAEMLCSNAKKFVANSIEEQKKNNPVIDSDIYPDLCVIDWHLEFGEMEDGIENIRENYITDDGKHMELRPYVVCGSETLMQYEKQRDYKNFRKVMNIVDKKANDYARGKLKNLRNVIRKGEKTSWNYLDANRIRDIATNCYSGIYKELDISRIRAGNGQDESLFVRTADGKDRSILFDAIEMSDTFIPLNY